METLLNLAILVLIPSIMITVGEMLSYIQARKAYLSRQKSNTQEKK